MWYALFAISKNPRKTTKIKNWAKWAKRCAKHLKNILSREMGKTLVETRVYTRKAPSPQGLVQAGWANWAKMG